MVGDRLTVSLLSSKGTTTLRKCCPHPAPERAATAAQLKQPFSNFIREWHERKTLRFELDDERSCAFAAVAFDAFA